MAKRREKKKPEAEPQGSEYSLSEKEIAALTTKKVFARGQDLLEIGALLDATCEEVARGLMLRASCCGSEAEPYQVRALLDTRGVQSTQCSCPYDYEGLCKHVVALLLLHVREPDSLLALAPLNEIFEDLDRDDLIALLTELATHDPQLLITLHQFRLAKLAGDEADNPSTLPDAPNLRKRARGIIHGAMQSAVNAWQWECDDTDTTRRLIRGLQKLLGESRMHAAASHDASSDLVSGLFHDAVLHEIGAAYHDSLHMLDEDGEISEFADECAQELRRCLKSLTGEAEHTTHCNQWKETLKTYRTMI